MAADPQPDGDRTELDGRDVAPDRKDGAPSPLNPDRTGPSRDDEPAPGNVHREEPSTETSQTAQGAFRSEDDPQAGEVAKLPGS